MVEPHLTNHMIESTTNRQDVSDRTAAGDGPGIPMSDTGTLAGPLFFTSMVTSVSLPVSTTRIRGHIRRSHTSHGPLTTHSVVFIESPVTLSNSGGTPFASTLVAMVQVSENHSC